jgi:predicted DCC family thiol-disulfide oxidoreductase YuxK
MIATARTTLLYDDDCGFCRWSADRIRRFDRRGRLTFAAIQSARGAELLRLVPPELRLTTMHGVSTDGRVWSGGEGLRLIVRELPGGSLLGTVLDAFPDTTDAVYRSVVRNRERFGAWLGQDACAVDPSRGV